MNHFSIAELDGQVSRNQSESLSFQLEGMICAIATNFNLVVLQDDSGTVLLKIPDLPRQLSAGQRLRIQGTAATANQKEFGIELHQTLVVDNDGLHPPHEKSGSILLGEGRHPIRLEWFNGPKESVLKVEMEGPGIARQTIPDDMLWHVTGDAGQESFQPGIRYQAYECSKIINLEDLGFLTPAAAGVATNFSTAYRTRNEDCALIFDGFIQIDREGTYQFHLTSDDGSRLYLGRSAVMAKVINDPSTFVPVLDSLERALMDQTRTHWVELEGEVVFISEKQSGFYLELLVGGNRIPVTILDRAGLAGENLLHRWLKVKGVCKFSGRAKSNRLVGVFVPDASQMNLEAQEAKNVPSGQLTMAAQVRRLTAVEAGKRVPVRIQGVVIFASATAMVVRDSSGGVFVGCGTGRWSEQPTVGEFWQVEGTTETGLFSPVIVANTASFLGHAPLPEPIQPTRDQLMNGNMDAEYGELRGIVTFVAAEEITLLTADGKVTVVGNAERPLPQLPKSAAPDGSQVGSVVRIRGCFAPLVDVKTRQVAAGKIFIYPALVTVEDPIPNDPFLIPTRTVANLMWFDARASALLRTKLAGQILHAKAGNYFVSDGQKAFRVHAAASTSLQPGDFIEAVGFPKLDGPAPVLLEAQIRKTGHAKLPRPILVSPDAMLDRRLDSTLVEIEGLLISDTVHQGERILELQSGPRYFSAKMPLDSKRPETLPSGCHLRVTGVYASADETSGMLAAHTSPFELLVNDAENVVVLQRPPWWTLQRVVTMLLVLCGVLGGMFIWVALLRRKVEQRTVQLREEIEQRQVIEQNHAIEKERARVARDLHDELGAGLTEVGMLGALANTATTSPEARNRYLGQLTKVAHSLVSSLDEIVWAVNPDYDTVGSVVSYFSLFAESFLSLAGIKCRLQVKEAAAELPLDSKPRHKMFCSFKEALNNVVQHSSATEVQISFEMIEGALSISVIDNGRGFEFKPGEPGKDGLSGLAQRMQSLGGECLLTSAVGRGTQVILRLPLNHMNPIPHGQDRHR